MQENETRAIISWEAIYEEYKAGASYDQLELAFGIKKDVIRSHSQKMGWEELASPVTDSKRKELIARSRAIAIKNCDLLEGVISEAIMQISEAKFDASSMREHQRRATVIKTIAQVVDIVADVRARAVGDDKGQKDTPSKSTVINVLLPKMMSKPRSKMEIEDVIDIEPEPQKTLKNNE
jgi:hypothetical protein